MCVDIVIVATNLQVTLYHVDSAPALLCNGYGLKSWLAGHLRKGTRGAGLILMYWVVYTGRECSLGVQIFLIEYSD